mmetsp:Transcript_40888/g.79623  ORF Transcript_40888/g.79623 Transcript_40888/m.79623 type:complete len:148 (-) Transcript_40888:367-810(-)
MLRVLPRSEAASRDDGQLPRERVFAGCGHEFLSMLDVAIALFRLLGPIPPPFLVLLVLEPILLGYVAPLTLSPVVAVAMVMLLVAAAMMAVVVVAVVMVIRVFGAALVRVEARAHGVVVRGVRVRVRVQVRVRVRRISRRREARCWR